MIHKTVKLLQYYVLHKPSGYLSQFSKKGNEKTLIDLMKVQNDIYPVGRLDIDTQGLLILTNDTKLNQLLLSPSKNHSRTYISHVKEPYTENDIELFSKGLNLNIRGESFKSRPALARNISYTEYPYVARSSNENWVEITLTEGKYHQVRKMTALVNKPTLRLIRVSIEDLTLDKIPLGKYIKIRKSEIYNLLNI